MMAFQFQSCCSCLAIVTFLFSLAGAAIIKPPTSQTVAQGATATFHCELDDGVGFWAINGETVHPGRDFSSSGFTVSIEEGLIGPTSMWLFAEGRASNNNTRITCVNQLETVYSSPDVYLVVAGPPVAPRASFRPLNATAIAFSWDTPFFIPNVSDILSYTLRLYSRGRIQDRKEWTVVPQEPDSSTYTHVVTADGVATGCEQLVFEVSATNAAGTSPTQSVVGGFPVVPVQTANVEQPEVNVRPASNGLMTAEVTFQLLSVCPYQPIKYTLYVKQLSIGSVTQGRQIELIPDPKQTAVSTMVTGLSSNFNTLFTVVVQTATGEMQFPKVVLKQNLPVLKLSLSTVVKGNILTVYPKPSIAVDSIICKVQNFQFQDCSSGQLTFNGLPDGEVVIQVVARSGTEMASSNATVWVNQNVNFCAPYLNNNMVTTNGGDIEVEFASSGRPSDYSCGLDSNSFIPCSSPFKIKNLPPGKHVLQIVPKQCPAYRPLAVSLSV